MDSWNRQPNLPSLDGEALAIRVQLVIFDKLRYNTRRMGVRRSYPIKMTVNGGNIDEVVIDPHYEEKHSGTINDDLILELVLLLDGKFYKPVDQKSGFQYFIADPLVLRGLKYRLVWLLQDEKVYVGVVNAFRR